MKKVIKPILSVACFLFICLNSFSQLSLVKKDIIENLKQHISNEYVSKDIAIKMCDSIIKYNQLGKYDSCLTLDEFTYKLTKDLRRISDDQHIRVTANHHQ